MMQKKVAKGVKKQKVIKKTVKTSKLSKVSAKVKVRKKSSNTKKKQSTVLVKSPQPKLKQLSNYKEFFRYLLSNSADSELADES